LALRETGASVTAIEVDRGLVPILRSQVEPAGVRVIEADALRLDWGELLAGRDDWVLVANLPYNVATPLVATLLDEVPAIARMLVMVQAEVGARFAAKPRSKAYGAVSVKVAYWATASVVGQVPPSVFLPRPNVDSALVAIQRRPQPAVDPSLVPPKELFELVRAGFGKRRKMLRSALAERVTPAQYAAADVAPTCRAEELDIDAWGRLALAVRGSRP
jgi:16S rRNA (adenine1518-N6/adenine1519-N6)-dimethyltransferase